MEQPPNDDAAPGWEQPTTGDVALRAVMEERLIPVLVADLADG